MAKAPLTLHRCSNSECDYEQARWFGLCPRCKNGNGVEVARASERANVAVPKGSVPAASFRDLSEVRADEYQRDTTGIIELDRVLGGGIVPGSYIVLAGEPGSGKTTISTQLIIRLSSAGKKVAYVSGEESEAQTRMRFERLGADFGAYPLPISNETSVERICEAIEGHGFDFVVVDSIQTLFSEGVPGAPGSVSQVRECAHKLLKVAKDSGSSVLLIGHVTKDGDMAGPRTLEHMVDVVLAFEGDRAEQHRMLRSAKNRFGSTDEIAVFEMTGTGLVGIEDASKLFLSEHTKGIPGSAIGAIQEGTRIVLCEVQALVRPNNNSPNPIRAARGLDPRRVQMLLAVLSRKCGYRLGSMDVFLNVAGGLKVDEPAIDLAVCLAVASACDSRPVLDSVCAFGEVSLLGEVRPAPQAERRRKEAQRLGFSTLEPTGALRNAIKDALGAPVDEPGLDEDSVDADD